MARKPFESLSTYRERYGDPFLVPMANGKVVITAQPELIRQIFANKDTELFGPFAFEASKALVGERSLLMMGGAEHKRERKLLNPPFHGERMRAYGTVMIEATRAAFAQLGKGDEFVALDHTTQISLDAIVRAVFGFTDDSEVEATKVAVRAAMEGATPFLLFSEKTQVAPFGLGPWASYQRKSGQADALLYAHIEQSRGKTEGRRDILAMMLDARYDDGGEMADSAIRDELRTLLIAGHETTAVSLAWSLYGIHRHEEVLERLRSELDGLGDDPSPEAIAGLPYLSAVVDETLRLYPIVEVAFRRLLRPWTFAGFDLPAGITLCPAITLVHHDPSIYPEPERFNPERFLGKKPRPHEYLPFGGGNRRCIGASFSHYESRLALATMLREFEFELCDSKPAEAVRKNVVLAPKGGVRMRVRARR